MREDAGCTRAAVAALAGVDPSADHETRGAGHRPDARDVRARSRRRSAPTSRRRCTPTPGRAFGIATRSARPRSCWRRFTRAGARRPRWPSADRSAAGSMSPFTTRRPGWWWPRRSSRCSAGSSSCSGGARRRPKPCHPRQLGPRGPRRAGRRSPGSSSCARRAPTGRWPATPGGCWRPPTRRIREMRSTRSPERRPGPARRCSGCDSRGMAPAPCSRGGRDATAPGGGRPGGAARVSSSVSSPLGTKATRQEVASTSASASANGSRLADVKPATLIRPLPTT